MGTDYKFTVFGKDFRKEYTPQQISSFILQKIKRDAEAFLLEDVDKAVIMVPASCLVSSVEQVFCGNTYKMFI